MSTTILQIQALVCVRHRLCARDLLSRRRSVRVARPRQVAMWLARHITPCSLPEIGRAFNRDHTTVMHAIDRVAELMRADTRFTDEVLGLLDELCAEAGADYRRIAA
jgi:chromosomal replication initiator protein